VGVPVVLLLGIAAWSAFVVALAVYHDAFGRAQQEAERPGQSDT
jgi:hypothetical protein